MSWDSSVYDPNYFPTSAFTDTIPTVTDSLSSSYDQNYLQCDILNTAKELGLEEFGKRIGWIQGDGIPELRTYNTEDTAGLLETKLKLEPPQVAKPVTKDDKQPIKATVIKEEPTTTKRGRKRKHTPAREEKAEITEGSATKRRKAVCKGLRHFSKQVCLKVQQKGQTTYNEVADELVAEVAREEGDDKVVDQKNIRRRVYDALNVLRAMDIISKEKKDIRWIGLPTTGKEELHNLQAEKDKLAERIKRKTEYLQDLDTQFMLYKSLLNRNKQPNIDTTDTDEKLFLPFIIIHTKKETVIECEMSEDRSEYFFDFSMPFQIHDDNEILKRLGLSQAEQPQDPVPPINPSFSDATPQVNEPECSPASVMQFLNTDSPQKTAPDDHPGTIKTVTAPAPIEQKSVKTPPRKSARLSSRNESHIAHFTQPVPKHYVRAGIVANK